MKLQYRLVGVLFLALFYGCSESFAPSEKELNIAISELLHEGIEPVKLDITAQESDKGEVFTRFEYTLTFTDTFYVKHRVKVQRRMVLVEEFKAGDEFLLYGKTTSEQYMDGWRHTYEFDNPDILQKIRLRKNFPENALVYDTEEFWDASFKDVIGQ